ncbi:MAG: hypothetical protein FJZ01_03815 [Candidatus Sericytochromatia bacterium]|nr:hypothetical protein [Candidatus Tanganyikabacteria bacterium]
MAEAEVHERTFSLSDPDLDSALGQWCEACGAKAQAQGATGVIALRRVEGDDLVCAIIPAGTPQEAVRLEDHRQRGFEVADRLAIQHRPAPAASTSDLLRRVQEAQRKQNFTPGKPGDPP